MRPWYFSGRGRKALGEDHKAAHRQGEFVGLGAEEGALEAHDVADVQLLEPAEGLVPQHLALHVGLDAAGAVLEMAERRLAELAHQHEAAGQAEGGVQLVELRPGHGPVLGQHLLDGVAGDKAVVEGVEARPPKLLDFFPALGLDLVGQ